MEKLSILNNGQWVLSKAAPMIPKENFTFTHKPEYDFKHPDGSVSSHYQIHKDGVSHGNMLHNNRSTMGGKFNQAKDSSASSDNVHAAFNHFMANKPQTPNSLA